MTDTKTITTQSVERIRRQYFKAMAEQMEILSPMLEKMYKKLSKYVYKMDRTEDHNRKVMKSFGDCDYSIGIVDPKAFTHNKRALYLHTEGAQYLIQFIDEPFEDRWHNMLNKGIRITRIFNKLDMGCITNAWGYKKPEQFVTGSHLIEQVFTDHTEHSQVISAPGRRTVVVVRRPTMSHVIEDFNRKDGKCFYGPVFSTADNSFEMDMAMTENAFYYLIVGCQELKIEGASLY
jgi:hypothetical protein